MRVLRRLASELSVAPEYLENGFETVKYQGHFGLKGFLDEDGDVVDLADQHGGQTVRVTVEVLP